MAHAAPQRPLTTAPRGPSTAASNTLHIHQKQLYALISIGQYTFHKLLEHFSQIAEPTAGNGGEALSWIFTKGLRMSKNCQTFRRIQQR